MNLIEVPPKNGNSTFAQSATVQVVQKYARLVDRLLFWTNNNMEKNQDLPSKEYINELCREFPQIEIEIRMAQRCGENLAEVISDAVNPLMLLFPKNDEFSAENLYLNSLVTKAVNNLIQQALSILINTHFAEESSLDILEIGAGTGGTTTYVLPVVSEKAEHYCYTDISEYFLNLANKKFKQYPFMSYKLFDAEKDIEEQGLNEGIYDLIIAANVLHATKDIESSLKNINKLLRKNGLLLLMESTEPSVWLDITFGLLEGWWRFTDNRSLENNPVLSTSKWRQALINSNFSAIYTISVPFDSKQSLIIAKSNNTYQYTGTVLRRVDSREGIKETGRLKDEDIALDETTKQFQAKLAIAQSIEYPVLVKEFLKQQMKQITKIEPDLISDTTPMTELGVDSLMATELFNQLHQFLKPYFELSFIDYATQQNIQSLTDFVSTKLNNYFQSNDIDLTKVDSDTRIDIVMPDFNPNGGK